MRALRSGFPAVSALITCPCPLPLLLAVLAGTSAGTLLARYQGPAFGVTAVVVAASVYLMFRRLGEGGHSGE